jgi:hypothetical protein
MPIDKPKAGETKDEYLGYCIPEEIKAGYEVEQATAICISYYDKDKLSKIKDTTSKVMASVAYNTKFRGINLLAAAGDDPCWDGYEMIGMKDDGTPNCVPIKMAEVGPRGGIKESDKAPKSDTANPNPKGEGTAKGDASGKSAKVTAEQEKTLEGKVKDFNEKESNTKNGNATLGQLKSVFQRGLGAFNTSHSPAVKSAEQWAYARVNAYLYLLKNGRPENPKYDTDYDLLPKTHPKANK